MKGSSKEDQIKNEDSSGFIGKLKKNDVGLRLLLGFICVLAILLFLHFREERVEVLELHSTANRFVVAQVDFEFPDDEATIILRQEALRDIGKIYEIDSKQLRGAQFEFQTYLMHSQDWKNGNNISYEDISETSNAFEDILVELRFADSRTIQKMKELNMDTRHYLLFTSPSDKPPIVLPKDYWRKLKDFSFAKELKEKLGEDTNKAIINLILNFFEQKDWTLIHDLRSEDSFKKAVRKHIPTKFTRIRAGDRVISQGDKVSSTHIAMLQGMKQALNESRNLFSPITMMGNFLMSLMLVVLIALYLRMDQREIFNSLQKLSLITCVVILSLAFAKITEYILLETSSDLLDAVRFPILVPFATILLCILLNHRVALLFALIFSILFAIILAVEHSKFLVINLITSLVVIISTRTLRKRKEVFGVCAKSFLSAIPVIFAFNFINDVLWTKSLIMDIGCTFFFALVIAILVVGLLPVLESLFNVMTDITLMEWTDPNNELLRRLALEMPGTYQHSLVLGNLAEAAAQAIGANGLFCRVATLYHDIGKLNNPHYFTENQQSEVNIHQLLTPAESAQVITSHVKEGEMLARKYRLPQPFIDIIREHHGTTLVYYFYRKELDLKGGDPDLVDESQFRYPGPKPHSKESVIVMVADTVEAASRSLEDLSEEHFTNVVDKLVKEKQEDGQFNESCLTFEELGIIKRTLVKTLLSIRHMRIKYPESIQPA